MRFTDKIKSYIRSIIRILRIATTITTTTTSTNIATDTASTGKCIKNRRRLHELTELMLIKVELGRRRILVNNNLLWLGNAATVKRQNRLLIILG